MKCLLPFLLLATHTALAEAPRDFAFGIPLATEGDAAFYRVELPAAVYQGTARLDQGDLRVFNADGAMVPFAYVPHARPAREKAASIPVPLFPLRVEQTTADLNGLALSVNRTAAGTTINLTSRDGRPVAGERLAGYIVDASALDEPMTALVLAWSPPALGLSTRIRIEAGDDLAAWRSVVSDAPLIDLQYEHRRLTRDRVEFSPLRAKYLRLSWAASQPPVELTAVRIETGERVIEAQRRWTEASGVPIHGRENSYEFDLKGGFPIDRIAIDLPELNSVVPAQLYAYAQPGNATQPMATVILYRLRQGDGEVTSLPIAVSGASLRYWLLHVDPDSGGLGSGQPRMRAGWLPQELVFAARGAGPFTIAYGSATATPSALPIATLVPGYGTKSAPAIGTATAKTGTALGGPEKLAKPIDGKRLLLWGTLVLAVVMLGWMAWRLSRQMAASNPTENKPPE
jgi:hypothetical protein